jgi:hypothetical protein
LCTDLCLLAGTPPLSGPKEKKQLALFLIVHLVNILEETVGMEWFFNIHFNFSYSCNLGVGALYGLPG